MASEKSSKPRVGVPWRTLSEEKQNKRPKIDHYLKAVEAAGGEPVLLSLETPVETLHELAGTLDAFVLPGSPADVDPSRYGAARHPETATPDGARERMDFALLDHALEKHKPVLDLLRHATPERLHGRQPGAGHSRRSGRPHPSRPRR